MDLIKILFHLFYIFKVLLGLFSDNNIVCLMFLFKLSFSLILVLKMAKHNFDKQILPENAVCLM